MGDSEVCVASSQSEEGSLLVPLQLVDGVNTLGQHTGSTHWVNTTADIQLLFHWERIQWLWLWLVVRASLQATGQLNCSVLLPVLGRESVFLFPRDRGVLT